MSAFSVDTSLSPPVVRIHDFPPVPMKISVGPFSEPFHSAREAELRASTVIVPSCVAPRDTFHFDSVPGLSSAAAAASNTMRLRMRSSFHFVNTNRFFLALHFDVIEVNQLEFVSNSRFGELADDDLGSVILVLPLEPGG